MEQSNADYSPKVGKCGLNNIGNTCYMNSILQLLLHCKPLISFLIKKDTYGGLDDTENKADYEQYLEKAGIENIAREERKRLKLDKDVEVSIRKIDLIRYKSSSITKELACIVDAFIHKGASIITPGSFKQAVDRKISAFRGYSQHDAHEFIIHIIDAIIEETGIESQPKINNVPQHLIDFYKKITYYRHIMKDSNLEKKKEIIEIINDFKEKNKEAWTKYNGLKYMASLYETRYNPFIYQIQTILVHTVECTECKNITTNHENTPVLQLYVHDSLTECLDNLIKTETIENYKCDVCNANRTINKSCRLWRIPTVLFVQLKRFESLSNGRMRKNNNHVDIPLTLDLSPYCDLGTEGEIKINRRYNLKGYSNHMGSLSGGHYTADCLCIVDNKTWYHFDDSRVLRNTNNMIDTSNAYILMYELV
jgi:ubiquitin C-terminal hydrolase